MFGARPRHRRNGKAARLLASVMDIEHGDVGLLEMAAEPIRVEKRRGQAVFLEPAPISVMPKNTTPSTVNISTKVARKLSHWRTIR